MWTPNGTFPSTRFWILGKLFLWQLDSSMKINPSLHKKTQVLAMVRGTKTTWKVILRQKIRQPWLHKRHFLLISFLLWYINVQPTSQVLLVYPAEFSKKIQETFSKSSKLFNLTAISASIKKILSSKSYQKLKPITRCSCQKSYHRGFSNIIIYINIWIWNSPVVIYIW